VTEGCVEAARDACHGYFVVLCEDAVYSFNPERTGVGRDAPPLRK
jgi:hypothetical protein